MSQDLAQEARVAVRVENTKKNAVIGDDRKVGRHRHLRRREEVETVLLVGAQDRQGGKRDTQEVGLAHPVLIDLADR